MAGIRELYKSAIGIGEATLAKLVDGDRVQTRRTHPRLRIHRRRVLHERQSGNEQAGQS